MKVLHVWPALLLMSAACASTPAPAGTTTPASSVAASAEGAPPARAKEAPPPSEKARDLSFPAVQHVTLDNGLVVDVVSTKQLPIVSVQLVIQSGSANDPAGLPGVASAVADMLKEGTKKKKGAVFAEAVEFLGAHLSTGAGQETVRVSLSALSEHFDEGLALLAEAALTASFDPKELEKLKKRTLDELKLKKDKPAWLARREFQRALYGGHPYGQYDTTEAAVKKLTQRDLIAYHSSYFVPNNAFMIVVGDVSAEQVKSKVTQLFGAWKKKEVKEAAYAAPPERTAREIIVVDRPASVQSQIIIGNLALKRNDPGFIPATVANQVLGGSAASRLFMDLREKRSLTYGAYSRLDETVDVGSFRASAAVRTPVTGEAISGFFEHLERIVKEPPPQAELEAAHRFLADSFPLQIETPDRVAELLADLRVYGLPEGYWDTYRSAIRQVGTADALKAAQSTIHPDRQVVVVVGRAAEVVPMVEKFGPVRVVDVEGATLRGAGAEPSAGAKPNPGGTAGPSAAPGAGAEPGAGAKPGASAAPGAGQGSK